MNWIIYGKILAFAGPSYTKNVSPEGYCTLAPSDYIPYFQQKNVGLVVRLNQKNYDEKEFIDKLQHMLQLSNEQALEIVQIMVIKNKG